MAEQVSPGAPECDLHVARAVLLLLAAAPQLPAGHEGQNQQRTELWQVCVLGWPGIHACSQQFEPLLCTSPMELAADIAARFCCCASLILFRSRATFLLQQLHVRQCRSTSEFFDDAAACSVPEVMLVRTSCAGLRRRRAR